MKLKTKAKLPLLIIAICSFLIGLTAAYFAPRYEHSLQGTSDRGTYNVLNQTSDIFGTISVVLFLASLILYTISKQNEKDKKGTS